eukprot:s2321_g12.t1
MFLGLRREISQILSQDFANLQVPHEALEQPGGFVSLADFLAGQLQEDQMMIAYELRQFAQHTDRDMQRERRMLSLRVVRPRLAEPVVDAGALQETFSSLLKKELLPIRQVRKTRLSQDLTLEVGNPLQVAEEERVRWALELAQYLSAAELPVVRMIQESDDQQRSWAGVWEQAPRYHLEAFLRVAAPKSLPSLAAEDERHHRLHGREDSGPMWCSCATEHDGCAGTVGDGKESGGERKAVPLAEHRYGLRTTYPTLHVPMEDDEVDKMVAGWGQSVPIGEETEARSSKEPEKVEKPYWISVSRRTGFRRLHKKSCV